jgi:hypothetical protein
LPITRSRRHTPWEHNPPQMADHIKRRDEILKEITELGKLQKEAVEDATLTGRTTSGDGAYEERAAYLTTGI